jgi:glycosyltransferase involved in cell wall biosynthesis
MTRSVAIIGTRGYPSYYGGFETAVRKLAPYLADQGWDVTVYGRAGAVRDNDPLLDTRIRCVQTWGLETKSLSTLSYGLTATVHAMRLKPDVAIVMNVANGYWLPLLMARSIPTLVNVDGIEWDRAKWGRVAKKVFHVGASWTAKFGTRLVFDAKAIAKRWGSEFRRDGDFIPYGGDLPGDLPVVEGLTHRGYVLMVARFVPENTVAEFMDAARRLSETWPIVIVGSTGYGGELDDKARELAKTRASVTWLGHVSDDKKLLSLWQHSGAYFHGHSVGGTNPALVQAMACGAPIVARDTVYNREVLEEAAIFVRADSLDIEGGITTMMTSPDSQDVYSKRSAARRGAGYSWEAVCEKYESALMRLVKP